MIVQRLTAQRLTQLLGSWRGDGHSYVELSDSIELLVRDGRMPAGSVLPAERPLAEALGVSRTTVAATYERLRERGMAVSRRGSGTIVRPPRAAQSLAPWGHDSDAPLNLSAATPPAWPGLAGLAREVLEEQPEVFALRGYDTIGHPALRQAVADRFTARGLRTTPGQIMVTMGAQHAIFLIARTLLRRGDRALIESPSYPHAREALAAAGGLVAELPVGLEGWDAEETLRIAKATSPRLAYLIPDHHNPTGLSLQPELRAPLISQLAGCGSYVLIDETTAELTLGDRRAVTPFAASAEHEHLGDMLITVGSMGKTVWGGLRIGWVRAAPEVIEQLENARRVGDLGSGTWDQVLASAALGRMDEILDDRSRQLTASHAALMAALEAGLPDWATSNATGGVSVWADLGEPLSTRLGRSVSAHGLELPPGPRYGSPGKFERFIRLPFTAPPAQLEAAVAVLADVWHECVGGVDPRRGRGSQRPDTLV